MDSFKDIISVNLPQGYIINRIFAIDSEETQIEAFKNTVKSTFKVKKINLSDYFTKIPLIYLNKEGSYNDLYANISSIFNLGLIPGIDYYDTASVGYDNETIYLELPISNNSYGYKGIIQCNVTQDIFNGLSTFTKRNTTEIDNSKFITRIKFRNYLMGSIFGINNFYIVFDKLSIETIDVIIKGFISEVDDLTLAEYKDLLVNSTIVELYRDNISEVIVLCSQSELYQIRFNDTLDYVKNYQDIDSKTDDSKELLVGNGKDSAENPVSGEGDIIIG